MPLWVKVKPLTDSIFLLPYFSLIRTPTAGGELVLDTDEGERFLKLAAGSMALYPSTYLHRVAEVTAGQRLAAVSWVQSLVRHSEQRQLLFELDTVRRSPFEKYGKTEEVDLLSKTHANLLRQWAEM
jgi:PKHD-type hydroxylase